MMKLFHPTSSLRRRSDPKFSKSRRLSSPSDDMSLEEASTGDRTADITPFSSPEKTKREQENVPTEKKKVDANFENVSSKPQGHLTYVYDTMIVYETDKQSKGTGEDGTQDTDESPFTVSTHGTHIAWDDCSDAGSSFVSSDFQPTVFGDEVTDDFSTLSEHTSIRSDKAHAATQPAMNDHVDNSRTKINLETDEDEAIDFPTVQEFEDLDEIERIDVFKRLRLAFVQSYRSDVDSTHKIMILRDKLKSLDLNLVNDMNPKEASPLSPAVADRFNKQEVFEDLDTECKPQEQVTPLVDPMNRIQLLEMELLNVSVLLEQTITSVERLEKIPKKHFQKLWMRPWSGVVHRGDRYSDKNILHLERMCKIHQFTILKQEQELQALKNELSLEKSHHQLEVESLMAQLNRYGQDIQGLEQELSLSNNEVKTCKGVVYDLRRKIMVLEDEIEALEAQRKISGMDRQWMI